MTMRSLKLWLSLLTMTLVFLGIGRVFDRKCRGGCLREAVLLNFEDTDFFYGGQSPGAISKALRSRVAEGKQVAIAADLATVSKITVKSFVSNWTIRQKSSDMSVTFFGYRAPEEWAVQNAGSELRIETRKKGPQRAILELPADFKEELELINVSGEVTFEGALNLKRIKITNVSGLVTLQELPRETLELSTVTGSIIAAQNLNRAAPAIEVQSVSGDVDLRLKADFAKMHVESVSGSVFLRMPEDCSFRFRLESISGNFSGFPADAEESREFGEKDLEGIVGAQPSGSLHFETISGEFQLMQDRGAP